MFVRHFIVNFINALLKRQGRFQNYILVPHTWCLTQHTDSSQLFWFRDIIAASARVLVVAVSPHNRRRLFKYDKFADSILKKNVFYFTVIFVIFLFFTFKRIFKDTVKLREHRRYLSSSILVVRPRIPRIHITITVVHFKCWNFFNNPRKLEFRNFLLL